jgi:hypothetical protein
VRVPAVLNVFAVNPVDVIELIVMRPAVVPVMFAVTAGAPLKITGLNVTAKVPPLVVPVPYRIRLGAVVTPNMGRGRRGARAKTVLLEPNVCVPPRFAVHVIPSMLYATELVPPPPAMK